MNQALIIGLFLILGPILLVLCIAYGVFGYTPQKAQDIRSAEADVPMVMEEIRRIHIRSPDRFRHDRLDRHPLYIATNIAIFCYSLCVLSGAKVTSNIAALDQGTKQAMIVCFLVGSSLILAGTAMGMRVGRWTLLRGIRDNMTSSMLADDIRTPYTFGCAGLLAVAVGTGVYAETSFTSTGGTPGSLGGWMTAMVSVSSCLLAGMMYVRLRRYDRARDTLINKAVAEIERSCEVD